MRMIRSTFPRRTGSAAVELAAVAPVLVLMLLGLWEFGRMVEARQLLDNAAREGARYASGGNVTATEVEAKVINYLTAAGVPTTGVTVGVYNLNINPTPSVGDPSDNPSAASQLDTIRVVVTFPFNNYRWIVMDLFAANVTLTARAEWASMKDQPLVIDPTMPIN